MCWRETVVYGVNTSVGTVFHIITDIQPVFPWGTIKTLCCGWP